MAKWIIEDTTLTDIADAIRAKDGSTNPIMVAELASAIANIPSGGGENFPKVACGSFQPLQESGEEYLFEHELGSVPNFIIITQKRRETGANYISMTLYRSNYNSQFVAVGASSSCRYNIPSATPIHDIDEESFSFLSDTSAYLLNTTNTYYWYAIAEE